MAITYIGGDSGDTGSSNNTDDLALTLPAHQANDVAIVFAGSAGTNPAADLTINAEYTEQVEIDDTSGVQRQANLFYRVLTSGSDTDPTISKGGTSRCAGCVMVFRGVDTSNIFDVTVTTDLPVTYGNPPNPAITPTTDNGGLLLLHYSPGITGDDDEFTTVGIPTTPASMTEGETNVAGYNYSDIASAYKEDYGSAATITPTGWLHIYAEGEIEDGQNQGHYNGPAPEGSFDGGTGYTVSDSLTLVSGGTVTVNAESSGVVTQFSVAGASDTGNHQSGDVETATGGTGNDDFELTLGSRNIHGSGNENCLMTVALRPASTLTITDVDGDETWNDGDSGLVITGTGFV